MSASLVTLEERLHTYPEVKKSLEALLAIVEAGSSERATADEAELQVIDELRHLGHELLHAWAVTQETRQMKAFREQSIAVGHGKKNCIGIPHLEKSRWRNGYSGAIDTWCVPFQRRLT